MFGFVYEDSDVEKEMIEKYLLNRLDKINGLMILSGGCTMFDIAKYFSDNKLTNSDLTCVDFNPSQVKLVKDKIEFMEKSSCQYNNFIDKINLPFDNLFLRIKNGENFSTVFNNENLITQFGESAVKNTELSFATHFEQVCKSNSKYHEWIWKRNLKSKYLNQKMIDDLEYIKNVKLICGNFIIMLENNKYDFIQTSNLTDWMNKDEFDSFCIKIKHSLKPNGILIMRRLLSTNILSDKFPDSIQLNDKTNFYKETICFVNKV